MLRLVVYDDDDDDCLMMLLVLMMKTFFPEGDEGYDGYQWEFQDPRIDVLHRIKP